MGLARKGLRVNVRHLLSSDLFHHVFISVTTFSQTQYASFFRDFCIVEDVKNIKSDLTAFLRNIFVLPKMSKEDPRWEDFLKFSEYFSFLLLDITRNNKPFSCCSVLLCSFLPTSFLLRERMYFQKKRLGGMSNFPLPG